MMISGTVVRDSAETRALRVGSRWTAVASRTLSGAAQLRVTAAYAVVLVGVSLTLTLLGPHARDVVVSRMSTNLHNLRHGHMGTLVGSAFVDNGGYVCVWLPGLVCLLALGELIWRSKGLVVTFAIGHIGATLIVAVGLVGALEAQWLPTSVARASDVGVSYGAVCVLGALTASIPLRWRPVWIGWWLGIAVVAAMGADFTAFGHILALLLGIRVSVQLPSTTHWTPTRLVLLSVSVAFGYLVLSGSFVAAPLTGLAGALIALLASRVLRGMLPDESSPQPAQRLCETGVVAASVSSS
jgi:rhomboid family protein